MLDDGRWTTNSTPAQKEEGGQEGGASTSQGDDVPTEPEAFAFEFRGAATNTVKSSWLRRMSTLSLYNHDDSPASSPRPDSASVSFSNGSSAPILHSTASSSPAVPPRNKLVKRASSQRALHNLEPTNSSSPRTQIPTLRRPATSHQRSATIQQQYLHDGRRKLQDLFQPPSEQGLRPLSDEHDTRHQSPEIPTEPDQVWSPFFNVRTTNLGKEIPQKRGTASVYPRNNSVKVIVPSVDELPTLMRATSIESKPSQNSRPCTPAGFGTFPPSTISSKHDASIDVEQKPRRSFSIGDIFSSPSPSTWRTASLRRGKAAPKSTAGRRVVSAPLSSKHQPATAEPTPSSPLPSLNRLSVFEIDLPGAPSYPATQPPITSTHPCSPKSDASSSSPANPQTDQSTSQRHSLANIGTFPSPPVPTLPRSKAHRPSIVPSDHASTLVGSDNENSRFLSGDEDDGDMDCQSETVFDSLRTGATGSSHSGIRGPRIETIFDESLLPGLNENKLAGLADLLSSGSFAEHNGRKTTITEEEENLCTPIRASLERLDDDFATPVRTAGILSQEIPSSPPIAPLQLRSRLDYELGDVHVDEDWSSDDVHDAHDDTWDKKIGHTLPMSDKSTKQVKSNIFDWSEHQTVGSDDLDTGSSPRPNTVHGRHPTEARGSRTSGRRAPSGLHLRSQSVPVPPDSSTHRSYNNASKLDAWIQGQKTVSEDWDGDFEFDEVEHSGTQESVRAAPLPTNRSANILVPRAILERQATFHGQYSQVKELTLLVEELERLRIKASPLGLIQGPSAELWKEAEGIISLATVNEDDQDFLSPRSPHSATLEFDPFEDECPVSQVRRGSGPAPVKDEHPNGYDDHTGIQILPRSSPANSKISTPPPARPRKESSAKAKSVLEDILKQRSNNDPPLVDLKSPQKKLPFDTTSLRDLVTRAGVVTRALKEIVRRAENGPTSPGRRPGTPPDPPFSQMFQNPPNSPFSSPQLPKSSSKGSYLGNSITGNDNDINGHMKMMTVV
ncbi:MAG: hypothetical protein LQ347_001697 [Umbilicaria vellea]|nr:MAG: hypothetical protein LQ347_001697 [Umbilicaria vellea]